MDIEYKATTWKDGRGHTLMEGTVNFPKKRVTVSEPIDSRKETEIRDALRARLKQLAPDYT